MDANVDIVVNELSAQIANLAKEKAIYAALATQYKNELEQLRQELEELKNGENDESSDS